MSKVALISGISGMDGSLLAELLFEKGYREVHGLIRRTSQHPSSLKHLEGVLDRIIPWFADLQNDNHLSALVHEIQPDEIYHLAAQSDVRVSFDTPEYTGDITGLGTTRLLEAVRRFSPSSRVYFAGSSEMFGNCPPPQNEETPMLPRSPYGAAKLYSFHMCKIYREAFDLFISNGICFNHEHPRRGENFVTRKVVKAAVEISRGKRKKLSLGNLEGRRDWGYAPDYVSAMWLMLQQPDPDDFVIGTGETRTVRELVEKVFSLVGINWKDVVEIDPQLYRPTEVNYLCSDASKARKILNWQPTVSFEELVEILVAHEVQSQQI